MTASEQKPIVVVSGLPRSGTSMMMKILEAGGIEPLTDRIRTADLDNPGGYYELEAVKRTKQDPSWLAGAGGRVVKMITKLLYDLPEGYRFRIVFMIRDISEMLASQRKMMERSGKTDAGADDGAMTAIFTKHLGEVREWLETRENMDVLYVNYNELMESPAEVLGRISGFVGGLDVDAMAAVIDPALYRNRA